MKAACMMPPPSHRSTGAALVLVLWLVAALSLTVLAGAHGMRQQTQHAGLALERLRAEALLDGALQLAAQRLVAEKDQPIHYRRQVLALGGQEIWLEVTPATGLIDINVASDALLLALLQRAGGLPAGDAAIMVSRIRDFIDPDDTPTGAGGAEAAQYRAAGWPAVPRNSALEDISELKSVLGMTPELYDIIAPYLGVNGQQRLEVDATPRALIDILTGQKGLGAKVHQSPPESRAGLLLSGATAEFFSAAQGGGGKEVRVRAYAKGDGDQWWLREAWIDPRERPDTLASWTMLTLEPTRRINKPEQEWSP
jgi:general secretion pathway protein K